MWAIALLGFLAEGNRARKTSALLEANICFQRCMAWFASSDEEQAARGACSSSFSAAGGNGELLEQLGQLKFEVNDLKVTINRSASTSQREAEIGKVRACCHEAATLCLN